MEEHKERRKDCPEDWMVAAFIMHELDPARSQELTKHLSNCRFCMDRAAIYYKASLNGATLTASKEWIKKTAQALQGADKPLTERASLPNRMVSRIQDIIESLPPLPGYAVAAVAVVLLIWVTLSDKPRVITIASSQRIVFKDAGAPSSFGFMGREIAEEKVDMKISVNKGKMLLRWKSVDSAEGYTFSVKGNKGEMITGLKVKEPEAAIPLEMFKRGELYKLEISGNTVDGREFIYTGEFVLAR